MSHGFRKSIYTLLIFGHGFLGCRSKQDVAPVPLSRYIIASGISTANLSTYDLQSGTLIDPLYTDNSVSYRRFISNGGKLYCQGQANTVKIFDELTLALIQTIPLPPNSQILDVVSNKLVLATSTNYVVNFVPATVYLLKFLHLDNVSIVDSIYSGGRFDGQIIGAISAKGNVAYIKGMDQSIIRIISSSDYSIAKDVSLPAGNAGFSHLLTDKDEKHLLAFSGATIFGINTVDFSVGPGKRYLPLDYQPYGLVGIDVSSNVVYSPAFAPNSAVPELVTYNMSTDLIQKFPINSMPPYSTISCIAVDASAKLIIVGIQVNDNPGSHGLILLFDQAGKVVHSFTMAFPPLRIFVAQE
jgi:WD40 repeat protein